MIMFLSVMFDKFPDAVLEGLTKTGERGVPITPVDVQVLCGREQFSSVELEVCLSGSRWTDMMAHYLIALKVGHQHESSCDAVYRLVLAELQMAKVRQQTFNLREEGLAEIFGELGRYMRCDGKEREYQELVSAFSEISVQR